MTKTLRRLSSAFLATIVAFVLIGTGSARAVVVLDQSSNTGGGFGSAAIYGAFGGSPRIGQAVAQTFTVGTSGVLDHIDVSDLSLRGSGQSPLTLELRNVSAGEPGGTVLATSSVNAGDLVGGTATFDLSGFGLNFNIGDLLSFSLVSDSNLGDDYFVSVFAGSYAPGASFLGPKAGTGPWDSSFFDGADLHFQTFVDQSASVPAPGMLAIFGLGLAVIGCARRKRAA